MKLSLPDVTLVAVDTVCHDLTFMAIDECLKHVKFGDVKIFMDRERSPDTIQIPTFSNSQEAIDFSSYRLPKYIKTSHCLFIQWDSWIIDPSMWKPEFLEYDYIGAPWWYEDLNVGNSGFCLRSKAFMDYMVNHKEDFPLSAPEDDLICRHYRPHLPFKWPPVSVAHDFAFERSRVSVESKHFGFHGIFNWPAVMSPEALAERVSIASNNEYIKQNGKLTEVKDLCQWHKLALN